MKLLKNLTLLCLCFVNVQLFCQSIWGSQVVQFTQGSTNIGNPVVLERSNQEMAISSTLGQDEINFVSLGFGGSITVKMAQPIRNGEGQDLKIWETTYNSPSCNVYPEKAWVFASQDGCNFLPLGLICQDEELDLGDLNWALYIKIIDVSPQNGFLRWGEVDAFDVDAIEGYYQETEMTPTELQSGWATQLISYTPGLRKNGTPITVARTNPNNALGIPQGTDVVNFVSLGFGGSIVVGLDFAKFNQPGWDLQFVETSFGNPSCENYPEKAFVEVSKDLENWYYVDIVCLDGYLDVQTTDWFKYIRITDRSRATEFSASADGYDVDGILTIQECPTNTTNTQARVIVDYDDIYTPDDDSYEILYPNPFSDMINLTITEEVEISVMDYTGRVVKNFKANGKFLTDDLKSGWYYFQVREKNGKTSTYRLVKR
jgi:hypothetical protein